MLQLAGHEVGGSSIGGLETCIQLPGLGLAFDVGRCPPEALSCETLLFTHAHMDHMGGIAYHAAMRALRGMSAPTYVVPRENLVGVEQLLDVWRSLDRAELPCRLVALSPGEEHALSDRWLVRPFRSIHRAPCQGYVLWSTKRKLKPEYRGLEPERIKRLRHDFGAEITHVLESPEVAFTGDSRIEVVDREEALRRARLLILEVTFLDERVSVETARSKGHIHLDEVIERADAFENEALLFTHFSARYRAPEIEEILRRRLPPGLRARVTPLLAGHRD